MNNKVIMSLLKISLILMILISCATVQEIPPEVKYQQNYLVISPNQDGIQEELILKSNFKTSNFISYWEMQILNDKKEIVYRNNSGEKLEDLQKKLFLKKENVVLPDEYKWDGKDSNGKLQPDGKYYVKFIVMDNKKTIIDTETVKLGVVYIDTKAPLTSVKESSKIFSPNGDGNKDQLDISLDIEPDSLETTYDELKGLDWYIDILNNQGITISQIKYNDTNGYKKSFIWDGKDNKGSLVNDGLYSLKVYATDKGGNYFEESITNIKVDTKVDPVELTVLDGIFSPNGDKNKDTIAFALQLQDKSNIDSWIFTIYNKTKKSVKSTNGTKNIPNSLIWDGKNDDTVTAGEGDYFGELKVIYINGNVSTAASEHFTLDITPPSSDVSVDIEVFSPDGNNLKDGITIIQKPSEEKTQWDAKIIDEKNNVVISYSWKKNIPAELKWDGNDTDGNTVKDGNYYYQLSCTDLAGNTYESPKKKITVNTAKTDIMIAVLLDTISPDGNGIADAEKFKLTSSQSDKNPITDWEITIKDSKDNIIFSDKKNEILPEEYTWNGKDNSGKTVTDGQYTAYLSVNTFDGITSTKKGKVFNVDLTPPEILVEKSPEIFSPDNDGFDDTMTFSFARAFDNTGIKNWKLTIINPFTNKEFISFTGEGSPNANITWDGKGKNGQLVESVEEYPLIITAEDMVGNVLTKSFDPVLIDILVIKLDDGRYKIRISNIRFKPDRAVMTDDKKNGEILTLLAKALKKFPTHIISIEGYANEFRKGLNEKQALKLSEQRSITVSNELQKRGIDKSRISTIGRGFENPIVPLKDNMTEDERKEMAINRRVEFYLSK